MSQISFETLRLSCENIALSDREGIREIAVEVVEDYTIRKWITAEQRYELLSILSRPADDNA